MTDVLTALCTNPENTVWVVSGRKQVLHKKKRKKESLKKIKKKETEC
jgi:trehalose-6-phosphatase